MEKRKPSKAEQRKKHRSIYATKRQQVQSTIKVGGGLEWSAHKISPHQKTTPVWQEGLVNACDEVFVTLAEQNMSDHPSRLAGNAMEADSQLIDQDLTTNHI